MSRLALHVRVFGWRGVGYAMVNYTKNIGRLVKVRQKYSKHPIFIRLNTSDIDVFKQVFIDSEYDVVSLINAHVETIIDGGANIGLTTVFLANKYPSARIYAIEPDRGNFEVLTRNTSKYVNVHCERAALWDRDVPVGIVDKNAKSWAFRVGSTPNGNNDELHGYRLTTLMRKDNFTNVSLLKMDIEGAEFEVMSDAASWIRYVDNIVIELHDRIRPGVSDLFRNVTNDFAVRAVTDELTLACRVDR